jgi:site-specific recombinase XerC
MISIVSLTILENDVRKAFERYLRPEEERQLFKTIGQYADLQSQRDLAWMRVMRQTGIRVETMAGLNVADAREAITTHYLTLRPEITKGEHGGRIFVTKRGRAALRQLLRIRREQGHAERADAPLVMSRKHQRLSIRTYQQRMQHWCELAGLSIKASPHWWRHTLAKRIMRESTAQDPRGVVQAQLNHSDIKSTAVYTLPDRDDIEQALEEVS